MALPEGVTTCTVTAGVPVTHTGAPVKAYLSIEPSVFLVHTATGTPLVDFLEELDISEGVAGQFSLPHTDQAGFQDENGNAYTNWYYTARITYSTQSKAKSKAPKIKVFQLAAGQSVVDLDALPGGAPALPYTAPIATVTSLNGRTGPVELLDADLPERLSDASLSATIVDSIGESVAVRPRSSPPLARFRAALSLRDTLPVPIVFVGSSTTAGSVTTTAANRYANRVTKAVQDAYPLATGYLSPAMSSTVTLPLSPGIQGFNFGVGGRRAENYIDTDIRNMIAQVQPYLIIHMVGSNDYANGNTPAYYAERMTAQLAALRAVLTKPAVHVYVHSFVRGDAVAESTHVAPDTEFRKVLIDLTQANPTDTYFIDLSEEYAAISVPGTDPLAFLDPDLIHQNDKGHAFMADLIRDKLGIPLVQFKEAVPPPPMVGIVTTDAFSGADTTTLSGRMTDALNGGTSRPWVNTLSTAFGITGGQLVRGSNTATAFSSISEHHKNVEVSLKITAIPSVESFLNARRDITGTGSTSYRLGIRSSGALQLSKAVGGTVTTISAVSSASIYAVGDTVKLRCVGSTISAYVNTTEIFSVVDASVAQGQYAGISLGTNSTFGFDDWKFENLA